MCSKISALIILEKNLLQRDSYGVLKNRTGPSIFLMPTMKTRPLVKSVYQHINFLISQPKHMLWVLKRTVSMRQFF